MKYIFYKTIKFIVKPIIKLLFNPKVEGIENIPDSGRVILAGNHKSNNDAFIMIYAPKRVVHMMAKKELFNNPITKLFFKSMACISVDRSIHDQSAKNEAINVLNNDEVLGIFPEGTINKTKDIILPFKYGAVSFANKTDSCIVPFSITGEYKKRNIKIVFSKPYKVTGDIIKDNKILENKVIELLKGSK